MGMHVKVVDRSDATGRFAAASRLNEIYMADALTMVTNVLAQLRSNPPYSRVCAPGQRTAARISRLDIIDHGAIDSIQLGKDKVSAANFDRSFRATLLPLAIHFEKDGFAHLQNCFAGGQITLLEKFADTWGVPIVAGKGGDWELGVTQLNWDGYVRVYPANGNGRRKQDTFRWRP
jgi:hypothetical protein